MTYYCGIDLHSNNHYVCVIDENDNRVFERKLDNEARLLIACLAEFKDKLIAVAIESTFNWYWLSDALIEAGFEVRLVNTTAVIQYSGLKRADDRYDAFFLAHLMRLGILPTGYICPVELRGLRDLSRKRMSLVQTRTQQILSIKTQYQRATGNRLSTNELKLKKFELPIIGDANVQMALGANFSLMKALTVQIKSIEKCILEQAAPMDSFSLIKGIDGIGDILTLVILLETGDIKRFKGPETMPRTVAALIAGGKATVNAKVKTTGKMETSISAGLLSRPLTLRFATTRKRSSFINARKPKPIRW